VPFFGLFRGTNRAPVVCRGNNFEVYGVGISWHRGHMFDQPRVVQGVDLGPRCEVVGGSFFEAVPDGGDA
jgi:hypothetical protein